MCPYIQIFRKNTIFGSSSKGSTFKCNGECYPQEYVASSHYFDFCYHNNQNNNRGCKFFPSSSESWHSCYDCGEGVYDTVKFCPSCGARQ